MSSEQQITITPPDYLHLFNEEELKFVSDSLNDSLVFITDKKAHFSIKRLKNQLSTVMMIDTEVPEYKKKATSEKAKEKLSYEQKKADQKKHFVFELMKKPNFDDLVDYFIDKDCDLVPIDGTNEFTTQEMYETERKMIIYAKEQDPQHMLDEHVVKMAIEERKGISSEQKRAVIDCCRTTDRVTVIEGTAGAGKSFTMAAVKKAFTDSGYRIIGTALSWNAAAVLSASTGIDDCMAIEGLTIDMKKAQEQGIDFFRQKTVLIVDEAGLVGSRHMKKLLEMTRDSVHPIKVILTGDTRQLNPVNAGNALQAIVHYHKTTRIDKIRRQKQKTHRDAVKDLSFRKSGVALNTYMQQEALHWCKDKKTLFNMVLRDMLSYKVANPNKRALILALENNDVTELNRMVRVAYKKMGFVYGSETQPIKITDGRIVWSSTFAIGDEVVVRANSKKTIVYEIPEDKNNMDKSTWVPKKVGVFNRNSGHVVDVVESKVNPGSYDLIIDMDGDIPGRMILNTKEFEHDTKAAFPVVHNFATTVSSSQGQTVQKVFFIDNAGMDYRQAYVGMSRHTDGVEVYFNETELHTRVDRGLGRAEPDKLKMENIEKYRKSNPSELPVKIRRYLREEMLGKVASAWGSERANMTALMFGIEKKQSKGFNNKNAISNRELFEIKQAPDCEEVIDFDTNRYVVEHGDSWESIAIKLGVIESLSTNEDVKKLTKWFENVKRFTDFKDEWSLETGDILFLSERLNVRHPIIDIETLFLTEDVAETEIVHTAEINKNSEKYKAPEMPLQEEVKPPAEDNKPEEKKGFFRSLFGSKKKDEPTAEDLNLREYESLGKVIDLSEDEQKEYARLAKKKIKPVLNIPYVEQKEKLGYIDRKGRLKFNYGGEDGPTDEFIDQIKGKFWGEGRYYEPRIFAVDGATIKSRYDLEGNCLVGQGFPPTFYNPRSETAPFYIVPGAKEYLWTYNYVMNSYAEHNDVNKVPNVVWGAKDVDWSLLFKEGNDFASRTRITRGQDPKNIEWAINLQKVLWEENKVKIPISPKIEDHVLPWESSPEIEPRKRPSP